MSRRRDISNAPMSNSSRFRMDRNPTAITVTRVTVPELSRHRVDYEPHAAAVVN